MLATHVNDENEPISVDDQGPNLAVRALELPFLTWNRLLHPPYEVTGIETEMLPCQQQDFVRAQGRRACQLHLPAEQPVQPLLG